MTNDADKTPLDAASAAERFMDMVIACVYDSTIRTMLDKLSKSVYVRGSTQADRELGRWFADLDKDQRRRVEQVVEEAVDSAVFGFLVLLDGATGGYPLRPSPSDFGLYLHEYSDHERHRDTPVSAVRIDGGANDTDLHDLFGWKLEQRKLKRDAMQDDQ